MQVIAKSAKQYFVMLEGFDAGFSIDTEDCWIGCARMGRVISTFEGDRYSSWLHCETPSFDSKLWRKFVEEGELCANARERS